MAKTKDIPKYERVRERLRRKIESGEFPPGSRLPPQTRLFKMLNASDSTVVHALNDLVREGLIVRRRGDGTYVADRQAPPLISGQHLRFAVLWYYSVTEKTIDEGFIARISKGAMKEWGLENVPPEFIANRSKKTTEAIYHQPNRGITVDLLGEEWGGRDRAPPLSALRKGNYDGILTLGIIEDKFIDKVLSLGHPTVIIDYPNQIFGMRADMVYADPQFGYRAAVEHFVARKLRKIHFVGARVWDPHVKRPSNKKPCGFEYGKRTDPDTFLRLSAYRQAMDACEIEVPESWIHVLGHDPEHDQEFARHCAAMPPKDRPEAVICHGVDQAESIMEACAALGLNLVGAGACDGPPQGKALGIQLVPEEMGAIAADLLLTRIRKPGRLFLNVGTRMAFDAPVSLSDRRSKKELAGASLGF